MAAPTKSQRQVHREFLRRQKIYEAKYYPIFLAILARQYRQAAALYPNPYQVNPNDYRSAIINIYAYVTPIEAEICWNYYVAPLTSDRKDYFDDIASLLGFDIPSGEHIRLWRQITQQWVDVNILSKIREISQTTQRAIAKIIQQGLEEGLSENKMSQYIREQAKGSINQWRARNIARTESVMAMGTGRRMSMFTSNLIWDKKWVDTKDERTRTAHKKVALEDWRPLEEDYVLDIIKNKRVVGKEPARFPGDPNLSAGNVCFCRCVEVYQVQRDASGRPRRRTGTPIRVTEMANMI